jgi:hypothetical protein
VAYIDIQSRYLSKETEENNEKTIKIVGVHAEIQTQELQHKNLKCYRYVGSSNESLINSDTNFSA